mmetsp:Transcript_97138/g.279602  ORF Transcript_97138/g.279602 Transcript_97138/m.279602 type:complete len:269 (+) Transcript_97138:1890-2696(+)
MIHELTNSACVFDKTSRAWSPSRRVLSTHALLTSRSAILDATAAVTASNETMAVSVDTSNTHCRRRRSRCSNLWSTDTQVESTLCFLLRPEIFRVGAFASALGGVHASTCNMPGSSACIRSSLTRTRRVRSFLNCPGDGVDPADASSSKAPCEGPSAPPSFGSKSGKIADDGADGTWGMGGNGGVALLLRMTSRRAATSVSSRRFSDFNASTATLPTFVEAAPMDDRRWPTSANQRECCSTICLCWFEMSPSMVSKRSAAMLESFKPC